MQVSGRRGKDDKSKLSEGNIERGCVLFLPASGESLFLFCLYLPRRQLQLQQARSCWQKGIRQRVTHPPWEPLAKRKQPSSLLPGSHAGQAPCGPRRWGLRVPPTPPPTNTKQPSLTAKERGGICLKTHGSTKGRLIKNNNNSVTLGVFPESPMQHLGARCPELEETRSEAEGSPVPAGMHRGLRMGSTPGAREPGQREGEGSGQDRLAGSAVASLLPAPCAAALREV